MPGVSSTASSVILVAGALAQPHWVPPEEIRARLTCLARLSALGHLRASPLEWPSRDAVLPRELAHDRWLRQQLASRAPGIAPGSATALRRLAALASGSENLHGWLLELVHFHLAKDHLVLMAGSARGLSLPQARELAQAIEPLLAAEGLALTVASPTHWLLGESQQQLQVECASSEAAAGRNVDGYLPSGADARRYRRLLNEIQMTWHEHPVNQQRAEDGDLPINSVWLSGPVTGQAIAALRDDLADGRYRLEESLLEPRLRDDRHAWLDALQALDTRLHKWLTSPQPPAILLCGDDQARWLQGGAASAGFGWSDAIAKGISRLASRLRPTDRAGHGGGRAADAGPGPADPLVRLFTEMPE
jgi:hypothetical protein